MIFQSGTVAGLLTKSGSERDLKAALRAADDFLVGGGGRTTIRGCQCADKNLARLLCWRRDGE